MWQRVYILLIMSACFHTGSAVSWSTVLWSAGAAVTAVVAAPVALSAFGFTAAGIATGTFAAKVMSVAAIANGGGIAAGSTVAVLQSAGVVGLSTAVNAAVGSAGAVSGYVLSKKFRK